MHAASRTLLTCLAISCFAVADTSRAPDRLTTKRIAELAIPPGGADPKHYTVEIVNIGKVTLPAAKPRAMMENIREFRFPTDVDPPVAARDGGPSVTPMTPLEFETVNTGWTVNLKAKRHGKLIMVYGVADFTEAEMIPGAYGELAGPIHTELGEVITPNKLDQPKFVTTSTRFELFALPGEAYEVTLFHGAKPVKHKITVTVD